MTRARSLIVLTGILLPLAVAGCSAKKEDKSAEPTATAVPEAPSAGSADPSAAGPTAGPARVMAEPSAKTTASTPPAAEARMGDSPAGAGPAGSGGGAAAADMDMAAGKADAVDRARSAGVLGSVRGRKGTSAKAKKSPARVRSRDIPAELEPPPPPPKPAKRAGQLTAGEWRDLDNWSFWRALFTPTGRNQKGDWLHMESHWGFYTAERIAVVVKQDEAPVVDIVVTLRDAEQKVVWQTRTDNRGRASLFPSLFTPQRGPFSVEAGEGQNTVVKNQVHARGNEPITLTLAKAKAPTNALDVMFVVDTTGSMGDELEYLKAELDWVVEKVQKENGKQLGVRLSVNFYRDHGDAYLVRPFAFERDLGKVVKQIREQRANGGGDFPEAVEDALDDAINKHDWSPNARARLLFLVLDAPPHHNPKILSKLHELTRKAALHGIRIIPLAGSGINKQTEFLMRFLAVATGGTYTFLTDDSGIGGGHVKPTIGPHNIETLNTLLVRIINQYLS